MSRKKKVKIFKIILAIFVILTLIIITMHFFPLIKNLSSRKGQLIFKYKIQNSGLLGLLILLGFQIAQIFLIIIPGEPIEILAGMCYGWLWGAIFIMASSCFISLLIFLLVRKFGRKFVYDFCNEETVKKIENNKLFKDSKKIELIMFILFLLPGTPKDLLVYIAGLLPIKTTRFVFISTFARFPSIITSTLAGDNILKRKF